MATYVLLPEYEVVKGGYSVLRERTRPPGRLCGHLPPVTVSCWDYGVTDGFCGSTLGFGGGFRKLQLKGQEVKLW